MRFKNRSVRNLHFIYTPDLIDVSNTKTVIPPNANRVLLTPNLKVCKNYLDFFGVKKYNFLDKLTLKL